MRAPAAAAAPVHEPHAAAFARFVRAAASLLAAGWLAPVSVAGTQAAAVAGPPRALRPCLAQRNGIGQPADPTAARRCLQGAAETGEPAAMFVLAQMLADGEGGARDGAAAHAWLERAAELDYPEALQALALAAPDREQAERLMRVAAHALTHRAHEVRDVRRAAWE